MTIRLPIYSNEMIRGIEEFLDFLDPTWDLDKLTMWREALHLFHENNPPIGFKVIDSPTKQT